MRAFQLLIEAGQDALAYGADWYKAGGFPPGVFQNTEYEVDEEQADKIKAKLVRAQRRREPLVHWPGLEVHAGDGAAERGAVR